MNYFDLTGNVALVTGCSTGLGVQMARALANQGADIICLARRKNLVDEVAEQIRKAPEPVPLHPPSRLPTSSSSGRWMLTCSALSR